MGTAITAGADRAFADDKGADYFIRHEVGNSPVARDLAPSNVLNYGRFQVKRRKNDSEKAKRRHTLEYKLGRCDWFRRPGMFDDSQSAGYSKQTLEIGSAGGKEAGGAGAKPVSAGKWAGTLEQNAGQDGARHLKKRRRTLRGVSVKYARTSSIKSLADHPAMRSAERQRERIPEYQRRKVLDTRDAQQAHQ
jgi:hypothetical protein